MHLYHALLNKDNPLHLICKNELPKYLGEKLTEDEVTAEVQYAFLFIMFQSPGGIHLDGITHTSILHSVISHFKLPALLKYINWLKQLYLYGSSGKEGIQELNLDVARKWSSSQLSHLVRMQSLPREEDWIGSIVKFLFVHSHFVVMSQNSNSKVLEPGSIKEGFIELSQPSQSHTQQCFTSSLNLMTNVLKLKSEDLMKDEEDKEDDDDNEEEEEEKKENEVESDSSEEEDDSDDKSSEDEGDVDEEFKKRIKEALGGAAASSEESDVQESNAESSDDEFSDDAMMRIDPLLSDIFKQRKLSRKATKKNNRMQVTHFQLRCLDLLESFITRQNTTNPLVLDLVLPLLELVESSSKDPEKEVLAERATVILRVKLCKMKGYPRSLQEDVIDRCHDNIGKALKKCYSASGGVFLSQLVSHCCLFYLRVLSGNQPTDKSSSSGAVDVDRVCDLYFSALEDFMTKRESRIQAFVIQDFITRYPSYAQKLVAPLTKMMVEGIQIYRRTQACQMLSAFYQATPVPEAVTKYSSDIFTTITDVLSNTIKNKSDWRPKYMVAIIKLMFQCTSTLKDSESDFTSTVQVLKDFLNVDEVKRSQELTTLTWKSLVALGLNREKGQPNLDKKSRKRKKRKKNKDVVGEQENVVDKKDVNENTENAVPAESRKQLKARNLKEKKKLTKASKQKRSKKTSESSSKKPKTLTTSE
uniref:Uncharacterized protein n=1 Tax=Ciona savignyi TaxID=51511 RepID=H2Z4S8_CIOSA